MDKGGNTQRISIGYVLAAVGIVVLLGGFIVLVLVDRGQRVKSGPPSGVENINVGPPGQHTESPMKYAHTPPAGGKHNPVWQNCGFYSKPVRDETSVHSMEHGAVWITYKPNLPKDQINEIKKVADSKTYILASPYKGIPSPVAASAWGKQLRLDSADDSRLQQFIRYYRQGEQTPEPGAACTGGVGNPG